MAKQESNSKQKLADALKDMEQTVTRQKLRSIGIDESAERIQRAARKMIARKNFKKALYKLIIFRNILENKIHKEKMEILFAFEQLIINTEEQTKNEENNNSIMIINDSDGA